MRALMLITLVIVPLAAAQTPPNRPRLPNDADTNSARTYYQYGLQRLPDHADDAMGAFYWAQRLEPASADAIYAYRIARLLRNEAELWAYMDGVDWSRPVVPEAWRRDTLMIRAIMIDPFVFRGLSNLLMDRYLRHHPAIGIRPGESRSSIQLRLLIFLIQHFPAEATSDAYARGDLARAAQALATNAGEEVGPSLHAERARVFYAMNALDSARNELASITLWDASRTRSILDAPAEWRLSLGRVCDRQGDLRCARDAYEFALAIDSTFWGAAMREGLDAIHMADTTTGLALLGRAVRVAPDEYAPNLAYGEALLNASRLELARERLHHAAMLEPYAATAHRLLARVFEAAGDSSEARQEYDRYLALARRDDPYAAAVRQRLGR